MIDIMNTESLFEQIILLSQNMLQCSEQADWSAYLSLAEERKILMSELEVVFEERAATFSDLAKGRERLFEIKKLNDQLLEVTENAREAAKSELQTLRYERSAASQYQLIDRHLV